MPWGTDCHEVEGFGLYLHDFTAELYDLPQTSAIRAQ